MQDSLRRTEGHPRQGGTAVRDNAVIGATAIALMVPIILFTFAGFQVALTLVLAPLAGFCLLRGPEFLRNLYVACVGAGLLSIVLATVVFGDTLSPRYVLSLALVMTSPLYFFLGWYLCARMATFGRVLIALGVASTGFLVLLVLQLIATGSQVRLYIDGLGSTLNLDFLGLPVYGCYGVNSLSSLFVLQMFTVGAGYVASTKRWQQMVFLSGFAASVFLIVGSNGRSAQLVLPYLLVISGAAFCFARRAIRIKAGILLAVTVMSATYSASRMIEPIRIVETTTALLSLPPSDHAAAQAPVPAGSRLSRTPAPDSAQSRDFDELSSGRGSLLQDALSDVVASPIFGNGFASFGRVNPSVGARQVEWKNRTSHIHYLTILWKGGALFFLPYMTLVGAFWLCAVRGVRGRWTEDVIFLAAGVLYLFTVISITWDILLVPSAGALGFFLLGALAESRSR